MKKEEKKREVTFNKDNHVDVRNEFITADYPEGIKAVDMKLLRFVISQCRRGDKEFFEYEFSAADIAKHLNMDKFNLYREAQDIAEKRLFNCNLRIGEDDDHDLIHLFRRCKYKDGVFVMRMDEEAADIFLNLSGSFTEIPIAPILMMKKKNSIRIYELICKKFMNHYPHADVATVVSISLEELRKVTETEGKRSYDYSGHLKDKILNPSIAEIEEAARWRILVKNLKRGKKIIGFELTVWGRDGYELMEECKREGKLPPRPKYGSDKMPGQLSLFDL